MAIVDQATLGQIAILSLDADPSIAGLAAPIGSLGLLDNNTNGFIWLKTGAANTAWVLIPRLASSTQLTQGGFVFADASGNLITNTARAYWDGAGRFAFGSNAPTAPQSTLHLDRGTGVGSHIRFTAGTTTGQTAGDGTEFGIDDAGNAEIKQYENSSINFLTNNVLKMSITNTGVTTITNGTAGVALTLTPGWSGGLGSWLNIDTTGPSGIGTGGPGANAWIAYAAGPGNWFTNSLLGDICYRNSNGRILWGISGNNYNMAMLTNGDVVHAQGIRVGNTTNTTGGNIRYVADSDVQAYVGGAWRSLVNDGYWEASATASTTTTSSTDVLMSGMTLTPPAGTYMAWFSGSVGQSAANNTVTVSIYAGGSQIAHTQRVNTPTLTFSAGAARTTVATNGVVTVNGSQAVEIRWRRNAGTATCDQRTFNLIQVNI